MSYVWLEQTLNQMDILYLANEVSLYYQFKQTWHSLATNSTKGNYYYSIVYLSKH
jgi:hypothetical protein